MNGSLDAARIEIGANVGSHSVNPTTSGVTFECDGSRTCLAKTHIHGCFADAGDCDSPGEYHGPLGPLHA